MANNIKKYNSYEEAMQDLFPYWRQKEQEKKEQEKIKKMTIKEYIEYILKTIK